jgi:hypothetical protein
MLSQMMATLFVDSTHSRGTPTRFTTLDGGAAKGVGLRGCSATRGVQVGVFSLDGESNLRSALRLLLALETGESVRVAQSERRAGTQGKRQKQQQQATGEIRAREEKNAAHREI